MGVYIPDGQKPKTCWHCWAEDGGHCHAGKPKRIRDIDDYVIARTRHPNCPLVEIPTPHGRLIDGDSLRMNGITLIDSTDLPHQGCLQVYLLEDVEMMPTLIKGEL